MKYVQNTVSYFKNLAIAKYFQVRTGDFNRYRVGVWFETLKINCPSRLSKKDPHHRNKILAFFTI